MIVGKGHIQQIRLSSAVAVSIVGELRAAADGTNQCTLTGSGRAQYCDDFESGYFVRADNFFQPNE